MDPTPGYSDPRQPFPDHAPVVAQIGDISVTASMIRTPTGQFALRGSQWTVTDAWTATQKTPTWAIVTAIVAFCFIFVFSLLFLLAKEYEYRGAVIVTVGNGTREHVTQVPIASRPDMEHVYHQVNVARSLAAI